MAMDIFLWANPITIKYGAAPSRSLSNNFAPRVISISDLLKYLDLFPWRKFCVIRMR
jgi:hypothetical protein